MLHDHMHVQVTKVVDAWNIYLVPCGFIVLSIMYVQALTDSDDLLRGGYSCY